MKVIVRNRGTEIASTSYWQSPTSQAGFLYMSVNAATLRVLVPAATLPMLAELPPVGTPCDLTRATLEGRETYQLTWRDDPDDPYVLEIARAQCDQPIREANDGRVVTLIWYAPGEGAEAVREIRRESIQLGAVVAS